MRKLISLAAVFLALGIGGCGSDDTLSGGDGGTPGGGGTGPTATTIQALTSSPTLPSRAGQSVTISAIVLDANNVALEGITVVMSADSGSLAIVNNITDANGVATATLTRGGDPANRTITVTATVGAVSDTVTVNVQGTRLSISGPTALALGDSGNFSISLRDEGGTGIAGVDVDVSSSAGNTLSSNFVTTDSTGQASVTLTASVAGADTLTAMGLGETAVSESLNVSDDNFVITTPVSLDEIPLNTNVPVTLSWDVGGVPQAGETINFSATRGTLDSFSAITDAAGVATNGIQASSAGFSDITASVLDPVTQLPVVSTTVTVEFIADVPSSIDVQASPLTVGTTEQSAVTATVRDVNNNLVKGRLVTFELNDVTGGQLSTGTGLTNSQGQAFTTYTAGSTTSAQNGVTVTASLQANPAITDTVALTVAQRELFIAVGTGNEINEPNQADYRKEFSVRVTDAVGNGVEGVNVQVGILSDSYYKGFWNFDALAGAWVQIVTAGPCADEDLNRDGFLAPAEDLNSSGSIEAGNVASAVPQSGSGGTFTTDNTGTGLVDVYYAQEFARWIDVTLTATASIPAGTEFSQTSSFLLPISADDVDDENDSPPGNPSPFGTSNSCFDTN